MISLGDLMLKIGADPVAWKGLQDTLSDAKEAVSGFGADVAKFGGAFDLAFTVPLLGAAGAIVHFGNDFEEARNTIIRGTGAMGDELKSLEGSFERVFVGGDETAQEVSNTIQELNTILGLTGPALENLAAQIHDLGDVTGEELKGLVDAVSHSFSNWKITTDEQAKSLDYLMNVAQASGSTVTSLAQQLTAYGPILRDLGIGFKDAAGLIGQLTRAGLEVGPVFAGIQKAMITMSKAGIKDPLEALKLLEDQIKKAGSAAAGMDVAAGLFGKSAAKMVDAIQSGQLSFDKFTGSMEVGNRTVADTAKQMETISQKVGQLSNELEGSLAPLGLALVETFKGLVDTLKPAIDMIAGMAKSFSELSPEVQTFSVGMLAVLASIGPVIGAFGLVKSGADSLLTTVPKLGTAFGASGGLAGAFANLGGALAILTAAFAGFELGKWLDANIPLLHEFGDAIANLIVNSRGLGGIWKEHVLGIKETVGPTRDLATETEKLAATVRAAGVAISQNAGESLQQYALRVQKVAAEHGLLDKEVTKNVLSTKQFSAATGTATTEGGKLNAQLKALETQLDGHEKKTKAAAASMYTLKFAFTDGATPINDFVKEIQKSIEEQGKAQLEYEKTAAAIKEMSDAMAETVAKSQVEAFSKEVVSEMDLARGAIGRFSVDTKALGVTTLTELKTAASNARSEFEQMKNATDQSGQSIFTLREQMQAEITVIEKQIAVKKALGETTGELENRLHELRIATGVETSAMSKSWQDFTKGVSTAFENFSKNLASSIFNGDITGALKSLVGALKETFENFATTIISNFIKNILLGDFQKAIGSMGTSVKGLGGIFQNVFGTGAKAVGAIPGATAGAGGAGGGAGAVAGTATSGILGAVTAISSVVTAITGILGLFGVGRQGEKDRLNIIADKTSGTSYALNEGGMKDATLALAADFHAFAYGGFGGWYHDAFASLMTTTEAILDTLRHGVHLDEVSQPAPAPAEPSPTTEAVTKTGEDITDAVDAGTSGTTDAVKGTTDGVGDLAGEVKDLTGNIYTDATSAAETLSSAADTVAEAGKGLLAAVDSIEYEQAKAALIGKETTAAIANETKNIATTVQQGTSDIVSSVKGVGSTFLQTAGAIQDLATGAVGVWRAAIAGPTLTPLLKTADVAPGAPARASVNGAPLTSQVGTQINLTVTGNTVVGRGAEAQLAETIIGRIQQQTRLTF